MSRSTNVSYLISTLLKITIKDAIKEVSEKNIWFNQQRARDFVKTDVFLELCQSINIDGNYLRVKIKDKING